MPKLFEFQRYDAERPRMVTSFKGNQKLIFQGYRYNIHHIVPAKGVKTWRCVCAKKLTSARSWCKGRAETWDTDTQGTAKGEHNHPAEHDVAELEYFKSQLILAAIDNPNTPLNDLIDEASAYMSAGVSFGSRESLKKSLTVARRTAENGGFRLRCYKNSEAPKSARNSGAANGHAAAVSMAHSAPTTLPMSLSGTMASILSLTNYMKRENNNEDNMDLPTDQSSSSILNQFAASFSSQLNHQDFLDQFERNSPLAKLSRLEDSALSAFNDSGIDAGSPPPPKKLNSHPTASMSPMRSKKQTNAASAAAIAAAIQQQLMAAAASATVAAAASSPRHQRAHSNNSISNASFHSMDGQLSGVNTPSARSTPLSSLGVPMPGFLPQASTQSKSVIDKAIRGARANSILNKLSSKAAEAAARKSPDVTDSSSEASATSIHTASTRPLTATIETQTDDHLMMGWTPVATAAVLSTRCESNGSGELIIDDEDEEDRKLRDDQHEESNEEEESSECHGAKGACQNGKDGEKCGCRIVRICCCENRAAGCCRRRKRQFTEISGEQ